MSCRYHLLSTPSSILASSAVSTLSQPFNLEQLAAQKKGLYYDKVFGRPQFPIIWRSLQEKRLTPFQIGSFLNKLIMMQPRTILSTREVRDLGNLLALYCSPKADLTPLLRQLKEATNLDEQAVLFYLLARLVDRPTLLSLFQNEQRFGINRGWPYQLDFYRQFLAEEITPILSDTEKLVFLNNLPNFAHKFSENSWKEIVITSLVELNYLPPQWTDFSKSLREQLLTWGRKDAVVGNLTYFLSGGQIPDQIVSVDGVPWNSQLTDQLLQMAVAHYFAQGGQMATTDLDAGDWRRLILDKSFQIWQDPARALALANFKKELFLPKNRKTLQSLQGSLLYDLSDRSAFVVKNFLVEAPLLEETLQKANRTLAGGSIAVGFEGQLLIIKQMLDTSPLPPFKLDDAWSTFDQKRLKTHDLRNKLEYKRFYCETLPLYPELQTALGAYWSQLPSPQRPDFSVLLTLAVQTKDPLFWQMAAEAEETCLPLSDFLTTIRTEPAAVDLYLQKINSSSGIFLKTNLQPTNETAFETGFGGNHYHQVFARGETMFPQKNQNQAFLEILLDATTPETELPGVTNLTSILPLALSPTELPRLKQQAPAVQKMITEGGFFTVLAKMRQRYQQKNIKK